MNQKDLIKYGLLALGAYLIWKYIEDNGGLSAVLGTTAAASTLPGVTATTTTSAALPAPSATTTMHVPPPSTTPVPLTPPAPAPPVVPVSQRVLSAATAAGVGTSLNMDQWCYYYTVATGNACPIDPGAIDPGVYSGAGIADRTTPTDVGTWLAIMQNQAPQLGLTGLGLVPYRYTPAWLM